jgi:hypothetical protein
MVKVGHAGIANSPPKIGSQKPPCDPRPAAPTMPKDAGALELSHQRLRANAVARMCGKLADKMRSRLSGIDGNFVHPGGRRTVRPLFKLPSFWCR